MTVTNESGGRLNAFANEPEIAVITHQASDSNKTQILAIIVSLVIISIFGIYLIMVYTTSISFTIHSSYIT